MKSLGGNNLEPNKLQKQNCQLIMKANFIYFCQLVGKFQSNAMTF